MDRKDSLYGEEMGDDALERMKEVGETRHPCCWEPVDGPHVRICQNYVEEEAASVSDDQEGLF